jgi:hypothetical protein
MELRDALDQIHDIRSQLARTLTFRGYRAASTAFTAIVAIVAAIAQALWAGDGDVSLHQYLKLWFAAAIVNLIVVGIEMAIRCRRSQHPLQRELSLAAVEQFSPCIVAGVLLTYVLVQFADDFAWTLPGFWMILFGQGVFASRRLLSRPVVFVGAYYLLAGLLVLTMRRGSQLQPWVMGSVFGIGQLFAAAILYWTIERRSEERVHGFE